MKKTVCILLIAAVLLTAFGCGKDGSSVNGKSTLMIYMIGSDLEAKGGSATADLDEIAASGIDLKKNNVLVYAGGSKKWHNELGMAEEEHTVMHLTETGFVVDKTVSGSSMGDSKALTTFLDFAYSNYSSDRYSLILWNHGNGPVIGYGKDMLHDNDSLTLKEMRTAFENSPFSAENKLEWVGFDACMMASAELACVFDDYADYLVASQEIEPFFGWDYSFLSEYGKTDSETLLKSIASTYMQTCEEYYEKKGYSDRDTTLSVVDLSEAKNMESALEALFAKASTEVAEKYNNLTSRRVETRALGRASTGSEYDLIDLKDMASKLADIYPEESEKLMDAIDKTVIANETNTEGLCGLSLYYPFYNKSYYETDWAETYEELGLFSEYRTYLQGYSKIWLKSDMLDSIAQSVVPKKVNESTYNLELTPEQSAAYADAKFYILEKEGYGIYTPLFVSNNVEKKDNTLVTEFDGNIIYGKDKFNNYFIPVSKEHDSVGDITRYSIYVNARNYTLGSIIGTETAPDGSERVTMDLEYQMAVDNAEKDIKVSSLVPIDSETDADALMSGKYEEVDLSDYAVFIFPGAEHLYLTRYDNSTVRPLADWYDTSDLSAQEIPIGDEVTFTYEPLIEGEYYIIFEIEDTQGNKYCSEPTVINGVADTLDPVIVPEPIEIDWKSGNEVSLGEFSGVEVSMRYFENADGNMKYTLVCHNKNNFRVDLVGNKVIVNNEIYADDIIFTYSKMNEHFMYDEVDIAPGKTVVLDEEGIDFGVLENYEILKKLESLTFTFNITDGVKFTTLVNDQTVTINFPDNHNPVFEENILGGSPEDYAYPCLGIHASEQIVYDDGEVKLSLLGLGGSDYSESSMRGLVKIENNGTKTAYISIPSISFDGISLGGLVGTKTVPPGCTVYETVFIDRDDIENAGITSASKASIKVQSKKSGWFIGGFSDIKSYDIVLDSPGQPVKFTEGKKVIFEENGVRIALVERKEDNYYGGGTWIVTVVNESENDYQLDFGTTRIDGEASNGYADLSFGTNYLAAGEKAVLEINYFNEISEIDQLSANVIFLDLAGEEVLYTSSSEISFVKDGKPLK